MSTSIHPRKDDGEECKKRCDRLTVTIFLKRLQVGGKEEDMEVSCLLLILISFSFSAADEFYTSIGQMTELLYTEQELLTSLKDYISAEENKLEKVKRWSQQLSNLSAFSIQEPEVFLSHPVNAFKFLKRLNREWSDLEALVRSNVSQGFVSNLNASRKHLPNEADQRGVAEALLRLQDTYKLDTDTLARGDLPGTSRLDGGLTVDDCYDLGLAAYGNRNFHTCELWMGQALLQMREGKTPVKVNPVTLLDYHSYCLYKQGDMERALVSTKQLLEIDPVNERALKNQKYYEYQLANNKSIVPEKPMPGPTSYNATVYKGLCRGESLELTPLLESRLFCRYHDNRRHPNLLISPAKEEDLWEVPRLVRYHDVASDHDVETIKTLARPKLARSKVRNTTDNSNYASRVRISQNAWLRNNQHPVVSKLIRRVGYVTGLEMATAESMQVANYGVGGVYEPHIDFQKKEVKNPYANLGTGNRIATWLLYLSHVPAGGATVFPRMGAVSWPIKGSAVFWYNLLPSGDGDHYTQHAACPVLVGSKWVANTWLHEKGQEFRRRCDLQLPAESRIWIDG
ncbi:prolyl 4-hydroxylase subunit alpha-1-like [Festucalex cinctus]